VSDDAEECTLDTTDDISLCDDDEEDEDDDVHETNFHVQFDSQIRPHEGSDDDDALPRSHSSPTILLTIPSPHMTFVQFVVQ
jgi:hypothetical protein